VIVEGRSQVAPPADSSLGGRLAVEFGRKYGQAYTPEADAWSGDDSGGLRFIEPEKAIAWTAFPTDVTRFTFPGSAP
jgi:hypothetical protein